jgi:hypothetical protein
MTESELKMTPEEKNLLIVVAEALAKLLEERFSTMYKEHSAKERLIPFRALIETVKEQKNVDHG